MTEISLLCKKKLMNEQGKVNALTNWRQPKLANNELK